MPRTLVLVVGTALLFTGCAPSGGGPEMGAGEEAAPADPGSIPANEDVPGEVRARAESIDPDWLEAASGAAGIPRRALEAYAGADLWATQNFPGCELRWTTLAGIGYIESRHGSIGGNELRADGSTREPIIGIALDGSEGVARISDTDGGRLDGDVTYDRAVGPLQFLPGTWEEVGLDGSGDGRADPSNIDDAAAAAVVHLCRGERDMSTDDGWVERILGYNRSREYVRNVNAAANYYLDMVAYAQQPSPGST